MGRRRKAPEAPLVVSRTKSSSSDCEVGLGGGRHSYKDFSRDNWMIFLENRVPASVGKTYRGVSRDFKKLPPESSKPFWEQKKRWKSGVYIIPGKSQ